MLRKLNQLKEDYNLEYRGVKYEKGGTIDVKIKDWYTKNYPKDELGERMNNTNTFEDNVTGVGDSLIRERLFEHLAKVKGVEYKFIYEKWLGKGMITDEEIKSMYEKGGEVEFRKLANSKNFDLVTPDGRYEIEMGAFGIPKSIIDGDTRKDINMNPIARKYRSEIQEYVDANYEKGGEVKKKENNEMLIGGLAGILLGIFLNK